MEQDSVEIASLRLRVVGSVLTCVFNFPCLKHGFVLGDLVFVFMVSVFPFPL